MNVSLIQLVMQRVVAYVVDLYRAVVGSQTGRYTLGVAVVLLTLGVVAHLLIGGYVPGADEATRWARRGARGSDNDPWALAQRLAAEGRYTAAAHALYGALLARVAANVPIRVHPSKTVGDYARDLRGSAPAVFPPFREFARSYEVVIYGLGTCDRARFERLIELAGRVVPELRAAA